MNQATQESTIARSRDGRVRDVQDAQSDEPIANHACTVGSIIDKIVINYPTLVRRVSRTDRGTLASGVGLWRWECMSIDYRSSRVGRFSSSVPSSYCGADEAVSSGYSESIIQLLSASTVRAMSGR